MTIHYLAHGLTFSQLSLLYAVGKSTAVTIVHDTIAELKECLVPNSIKFPQGAELDQVISDFEALCSLPQVGAPSMEPS